MKVLGSFQVKEEEKNFRLVRFLKQLYYLTFYNYGIFFFSQKLW